MTLRTNARVAGFTFLLYIAAGVAGMVRAPGPLVGLVLSLLMCFTALVLAVTLYAITRDEDADVAMLALTCRVGEGVIGVMFIPVRLALRSLGAADAPDAAAAHALGALLLEARGFNTLLGATFFAVGSLLFSWLLLRGRMIPVALAWLGVLASILLVAALPLQLAGLLRGPVTQLMWLPMLAFEVPLGLWLLIKGVAPPTRRQSA